MASSTTEVPRGCELNKLLQCLPHLEHLRLATWFNGPGFLKENTIAAALKLPLKSLDLPAFGRATSGAKCTQIMALVHSAGALLPSIVRCTTLTRLSLHHAMDVFASSHPPALQQLTALRRLDIAAVLMPYDKDFVPICFLDVWLGILSQLTGLEALNISQYNFDVSSDPATVSTIAEHLAHLTRLTVLRAQQCRATSQLCSALIECSPSLSLQQLDLAKADDINQPLRETRLEKRTAPVLLEMLAALTALTVLSLVHVQYEWEDEHLVRCCSCCACLQACCRMLTSYL